MQTKYNSKKGEIFNVCQSNNVIEEFEDGTFV